jgi:hypothetical protein
MKQIQKHKKEITKFSQTAYSEIEEAEPSEMLSKPKILKTDKFFEELDKVVNDKYIKNKLNSIQDDKLKR